MKLKLFADVLVLKSLKYASQNNSNGEETYKLELIIGKLFKKFSSFS